MSDQESGRKRAGGAGGSEEQRNRGRERDRRKTVAKKLSLTRSWDWRESRGRGGREHMDSGTLGDWGGERKMAAGILLVQDSDKDWLVIISLVFLELARPHALSIEKGSRHGRPLVRDLRPQFGLLAVSQKLLA